MERLGRMDVNGIEYPDRERYARQIMLEEIGEEGQARLKAASVVVVGAGGLGSAVLLYLAASGIGRIGIIDDDRVALSNLQRQILYTMEDIGSFKAASAAERLKMLNPGCKTDFSIRRLTEENAGEITEGYDLIVDAVDNLPSRYVMDEVSRKHHIPFIYGSISEFYGQVSVFNYKGGPSYTDLFPVSDYSSLRHPPVGTVGALPGVIGSIQASEAIKILLDLPHVLSGKLLMADLLKVEFRTVNIRKTN